MIGCVGGWELERYPSHYGSKRAKTDFTPSLPSFSFAKNEVEQRLVGKLSSCSTTEMGFEADKRLSSRKYTQKDTEKVTNNCMQVNWICARKE